MFRQTKFISKNHFKIQSFLLINSSLSNPNNSLRYFSRVKSRLKRRQIQTKEEISEKKIVDSYLTHLNEVKPAINKPWRNILYYPARASWRNSSSQSSTSTTKGILDKRDLLLNKSNRTPRQLHRAYQKTLEKSQSITLERDRQRRKEESGINSSNQITEEIYYNVEESLSQLKYRLYPNYCITQRVLTEIKNLSPHFQPQHILDVGMGVGSASLAAMVEYSDSLSWIHGIEPSKSMQQLSKELLQLEDDSIRLTMSQSITSATDTSNFDLVLLSYTNQELSRRNMLTLNAIAFDKLAPNGVMVIIEPGTPDGFSNIREIREMFCTSSSKDSFRILAPCTHSKTCPLRHHDASGVNDSQESITKSNNLFIQQGFAEKYGYSSEDIQDFYRGQQEYSNDKNKYQHLHLPAKATFCSFVHILPDYHAHPYMKKRGEKFSYLVIQKNLNGNPHDSTYDDNHLNVVELLKKSITSPSSQIVKDKVSSINQIVTSNNNAKQNTVILQSISNRFQDWGRLVRAPIKRKGHVMLDYCTVRADDDANNDEKTGQIVRSIVSEGKFKKNAPGLYACARKARWGGLWPDLFFKDH